MYDTMQDWLDEVENFATRRERLAEDLPPHAIAWIDTAWRLGAAAEREACATLVETIRMDEVLLAAGEMTTQERRTVKALLPWLAHRIRNRS